MHRKTLSRRGLSALSLAGGLSEEFEALLAGRTVLGRVGEPDDVGCMVASLLPDRGVDAALSDVSALLNCAGPYMRTAGPLMRAAIPL